MMRAVYGWDFEPTKPFEVSTVDHLFGEVWASGDLSVRDRRLVLIGLPPAAGSRTSPASSSTSALKLGELTVDDVRGARRVPGPLRRLAQGGQAELARRGDHRPARAGRLVSEVVRDVASPWSGRSHAELATLARELLLAGHMIDRASMPHLIGAYGPRGDARRRHRRVDGGQPRLHQAGAAAARLRGRHRRGDLQGDAVRHRCPAGVPRLPLRGARRPPRHLPPRPLRRPHGRRADGRRAGADHVPRHRGPHLRRHRHGHQPSGPGAPGAPPAAPARRPRPALRVDGDDRPRGRPAARAPRRGVAGDVERRQPPARSWRRRTFRPTTAMPTTRGRSTRIW